MAGFVNDDFFAVDFNFAPLQTPSPLAANDWAPAASGLTDLYDFLNVATPLPPLGFDESIEENTDVFDGPLLSNPSSPCSSGDFAAAPASPLSSNTISPLAAPVPRISPPTSASSASRSAPTNFTSRVGSASSSLNSSAVPMVATTGGRGCPKRKRKTIQRKRQEQQARLERLSSQQRDLKETVRVATAEVALARRTLYNVLKTARQGRLPASISAPSTPMSLQ